MINGGYSSHRNDASLQMNDDCIADVVNERVYKRLGPIQKRKANDH